MDDVTINAIYGCSIRFAIGNIPNGDMGNVTGTIKVMNISERVLLRKPVNGGYVEQSKFQAISDITNGVASLAEAAGEHSKGLAIASKVLALAAGVAQAQSVPFPGNIAAIATTISTVLANIATATKTVKSVKFATGGTVVGPGPGTSDSIPAQLSNGESVMIAMATSMFAPLLSLFNMMGGGVPINVTANNSQAIGEEMLAQAIAKGFMMAPPPILSVEEFTSVANRTKYVENLGDIWL